MAEPSRAARAGAFLMGAVIGVLALWGALWAFLAGAIAAQRPDPDAPDGDPCCGVPDTWGEVAGQAAASVGGVIVVGLVLAFAVNLIHWALTSRWLRPRPLALIPGVGVAIAVLGIGTGLAIG